MKRSLIAALALAAGLGVAGMAQAQTSPGALAPATPGVSPSQMLRTPATTRPTGNSGNLQQNGVNPADPMGPSQPSNGNWQQNTPNH